MNQPVHFFKDHHKYLIRLGSIVQQLIKEPTQLKGAIRVRKNNRGKIIGWEIDNIESGTNNT